MPLDYVLHNHNTITAFLQWRFVSEFKAKREHEHAASSQWQSSEFGGLFVRSSRVYKMASTTPQAVACSLHAHCELAVSPPLLRFCLKSLAIHHCDKAVRASSVIQYKCSSATCLFMPPPHAVYGRTHSHNLVVRKRCLALVHFTHFS